MSTFILPFLLGAVLGMRFRVLVLFAAILVMVMTAAIAGFASANSIPSICLDATLIAISLQIGYLSTILIRSSKAPAESGAVAEISRSV